MFSNVSERKCVTVSQTYSFLTLFLNISLTKCLIWAVLYIEYFLLDCIILLFTIVILQIQENSTLRGNMHNHHETSDVNTCLRHEIRKQPQ